MRARLYGPVDYAKTLKLPVRVGNLDLPERKRCTSSREEDEMRKIDQCDREKCSTLDNSKKTVGIVADRWWPQKAKQERDKVSKTFYVIYGKNVMRAQTLEVSLLGLGMVLRL